MLPLPELLLKLRPRTLKTLATVVGPVPNLAPDATPPEIARALFLHSAGFRAPIHFVNDISEMFNVQAAAAVFSILPRIASEVGHLAAIACMRVWDDPRAKEWGRLSPFELAAALAIEVATTMDVAEKTEAYNRASAFVTRAIRAVDAAPAERPTYELVARSPIVVDAKRIEAALRRAFGEDITDVWPAIEMSDGSLLLAVFFARGVEARATMTKSGRVVRRTYRPVTVDLLRVSADGSRVSLTLDTVTLGEPTLLRRYAKALRLSLEPSFSLREIHPSTIEALMARVPAGTRMEIAGLGFSFPDESEHEIDGKDAWTAAKEDWDTGTLRQVRLRARDEHRRGFGIFLQAPHRIEIPDLLSYPQARELLVALGLVSSPPEAAPRPRDGSRAAARRPKKSAGRAPERPARPLH